MENAAVRGPRASHHLPSYHPPSPRQRKVKQGKEWKWTGAACWRLILSFPLHHWGWKQLPFPSHCNMDSKGYMSLMVESCLPSFISTSSKLGRWKRGVIVGCQDCTIFTIHILQRTVSRGRRTWFEGILQQSPGGARGCCVGRMAHVKKKQKQID